MEYEHHHQGISYEICFRQEVAVAEADEAETYVPW